MFVVEKQVVSAISAGTEKGVNCCIIVLDFFRDYYKKKSRLL